MACLAAAVFIGGTGGMLYRNSVAPLKLDVTQMVGLVGRWVGVPIGLDWVGMSPGRHRPGGGQRKVAS